jgi:predicted RNase H-like HicB family nuclease
MKLPVLIEKVPGNGFRASGGEPLSLCAEGTTRDEAISRLEVLIAHRLAAGAELIDLDVQSAKQHFTPVPGWSDNDPIFDEWQQSMREYRRQVEDDPDRP